MSDFWRGFFFAISCYFGGGLLLGVGYVALHLAHFFSAGWRWRAMMASAGTMALVWPAVVTEAAVELVYSRRQRRRHEEMLQRRGARVREREEDIFDRDWVEADDFSDPVDLDNLERPFERAVVVEPRGNKPGGER